MRLAGYGLVLLALGGYEQASPVELCLSVLGLRRGGRRRAARAAVRRPQRPARSASPSGAPSSGRLAAGVGDGTGPEGTRPEAVVVAEGELEVSRIQTHRRGQPVTIKLMRRRGTPVELEASYGNAGHAAADASIERHRRWLARSPEHKLKLPRMKTGDPSFDQKFSVHGDGAARGRGAPAPPGAAAGRRRAHDLARHRGALPALTPEQPTRPRRSPARSTAPRPCSRSSRSSTCSPTSSTRRCRSRAERCASATGSRARYGGGAGVGIGGGALPGSGTVAVAECVGRAGWLSSSRIWRRAAGASAPPGDGREVFLVRVDRLRGVARRAIGLAEAEQRLRKVGRDC